MPSNDVVVELRAENEDLKRKLGEANAKVDEFKGKVETGGSTAAQSFKNAVSAVTSFIGKVTAAVGIATTFFEIGKAIREVYEDAFTTAAEKAKNFADQLNGSRDQTVADLEKEIARLQSKLGVGSLSIAGQIRDFIVGETKADIEAQIKVLEGKVRSLKEPDRAKELRDKEADAKKQSDTDRRAAYQKILDQEKLHEANQNAIEKEKRDREKAAQDLANELAKAADTFAEKMRTAIEGPLQELRRLNEQFVNTQNSNLVTSINRLSNALEAAGGAGAFDGPDSGFID